MTVQNTIDSLTSFLEEVDGYMVDAAHQEFLAEINLIEAVVLYKDVLAEIENLKIVQLCLTGK